MIEIVALDKYGSKRLQVETKCIKCGKVFLVRKDWFLNGRGKFCSVDCRHKADTQERVVIKCARCGKERKVLSRISNQQSKSGFRFCGLECRNKSQGIGRLIQPPHYGTGKQHSRTTKNFSLDGLCLNCGKKLIMCSKQRQRSYCCYRCQKDYHYKQYVNKWKKGEVAGNDGKDGEYLNAYVRRYMLEKAGNKCQKCGWSEVHPVTGKRPLTINHIDGISSNSVESNLEVLCPNCHSLTPTYGSLNIGKGRKQRRLKVTPVKVDVLV